MHKLVSIVIPTYNRPEYLKRCIESAVNQTYQHIEILVIDDSEDRTAHSMVESLKSKYLQHNIIYLHSNRGGQGIARNNGIRRSSGEIIAFLDDDDEWLPNKLEIEMGVLNGYSYPVAVYSGRKMMQNGSIIEVYNPMYKGAIAKELIKITNYISFPALIFAKSILKEVGLIDPDLKSAADWDFNIRLSMHVPLVPSQKITLIVNKHSDNRTKTVSDWQNNRVVVFNRYKKNWSVLTHLIYAMYRIKRAIAKKAEAGI